MNANIGGKAGFRSVAMRWAVAVLLMSCCASVQGAETVRLSSLDLSMMTTGWGQAHANRSIDGNPLTIAGKQYAHGVGTHAASRFAVAVNGATRFTAQVGVDDEVTSNQASVEFVVLVDGKERWRSGMMKRGDVAKAVDVALTGATEMVLLATDGGDGSSYDHADWAEAQFAVVGEAPEPAANKRIFRVTTAHSALTLLTGEDGRLYQLGYGSSDRQAPLPRRGPTRENEYYPPFGNGFILEPAVQATHRDGNTSVDLMVAGSTTEKLDDNVTLTRIELKDGHYPFFVTLCSKAYRNEDVIEQWAEIRHNEDGPVTLFRFASSAPLVPPAQGYWLTHFHGDWADEAQWVEERLSSGIKILDSKIGVRDGDTPRPVLLNNWEATYFDFDEQKIVSLFDGAKELGMELFLLDDGWFGNNHPRNNDRAGLGDWQVNKKKLPHGLSYLADEAKKRGLRFGIWTEPEMVNPASDLYERHPEWAIRQPYREPQTSRNQLALDLSRPEVREFVWTCIDELFAPNPGISYVKWDANRYITQPGSTYLSPEEQSHLLIDYNWALYDVMARMAKKYPHVQAMVCSGGSGRTDYGSLKYFHSFWPSDNTDPRRRVFIQWGFSHMFPACTIAAHATRMRRRPIKFTLDVAMSGTMGVDMDVSRLSEAERTATAAAVALYKNHLRDVVQKGDLYRLVSPYEGPRSALNYVSSDRKRAVLFVYQLGDSEAVAVKLRGLDPKRRYRITEVNLLEGTASKLAPNGKTVDGETLMRDGVVPPCYKEYDSTVIELVDVTN
jgi:alpha-galactosidase